MGNIAHFLLEGHDKATEGRREFAFAYTQGSAVELRVEEAVGPASREGGWDGW